MISQPLTLHEPDLLQRRAACPRRSTFETAAGSLILHSFCPPSLVTSLKADRGLHAFTHVPEREHQLLLGIPTNILLVRIGKNVEREVMEQLFGRLRFFECFRFL